ncbi:hypothetical protein BH23ACT12_BH23ACT12_07500 [soil metagenome]
MELVSGEIATIRADGYALRDGCYVFTVLVCGKPHYEFEIAAFPADLVKEVWGGPVDQDR